MQNHVFCYARSVFVIHVNLFDIAECLEQLPLSDQNRDRLYVFIGIFDFVIHVGEVCRNGRGTIIGEKNELFKKLERIAGTRID